MPNVKPFPPVWQPSKGPPGANLYTPLATGVGTIARNLAGPDQPTFVGTPTWSRGVYGPQLSGFTTSNFLTADGLAARIVAPPYWVAVFAYTTGTADQTLFSLLNVAAGAEVNLKVLSTGIFETFQSIGFIVLDSTATLNDGKPHVFMLASHKRNDHRSYVDGIQVASSTTNAAGNYAFDFASIGVVRYGSAGVTRASAFVNGSIIAVAVGTGAVPDPKALADDWLTGRFSAVRPKARPDWLASRPSGAATYTASAALTASSATMSAAVTNTPPSYTATAALTAASMTLAASAQHVTPTYTAAAALTASSATLAATATHVTPTYTATAGLTASSTTLAAAATHVTPSYTASAALAASSVTLAASAQHATAIYMATADLTASSMTLAASAQHVMPPFTTSATLAASSATMSASATFVPPSYTASADLATSSVTLAASASFATSISAAAADLTASPTTLAATLAFVPPETTGDLSIFLSPIFAYASGY